LKGKPVNWGSPKRETHKGGEKAWRKVLQRRVTFLRGQKEKTEKTRKYDKQESKTGGLSKKKIYQKKKKKGSFVSRRGEKGPVITVRGATARGARPLTTKGGSCEE